MARSSVKSQPIPQVSVSFDKAEAARIAASTPEENILWRVVRCAGYDTDENGVQHFHHLENIACKCKLGPQGRAYWSDAFETLLGGGRGGMKTESTFGFVLKGNPSHRKCGKPWDLSYVQHPEYKVLVLRKTQTDVDEWFDRFSRIAIKAGAKATTSPMRITWPKGGYISFGHLDDRESVMKYQGKEFWRIICEEAGHFEDEGDYLKVVIGSCRTRYTSQIWPQVLLTANPGGPGHKWLNARFRYPHGGNTPWPQSKMYSCPYTGRTRMWILSTADDNPYQMANNAEYVRNLELLKDKDPILYRRWRLGDFDAVEGQFFERFRKEPRPGEPANARHVILEGSVKLEPWYPRAIGVDWGYKHNAAVVWGCWTPKGQLHFYRDFTINKTDPVEFGVHIARMTLPELTAMPTHQITMFLSPDAFCRENGALSEADRIAVGIRSLLGEGSAFVLAPTEEEEKLDPKAAWESVERRRRHLAANASIIIVRAQNARKPGWQLIREYLRWWKAVDAGSPFDEDLAKRILLEDGALAWLEYKKQYEQKESETLPVLQIWSNCKAFIKEIDGAQESEKDPEDIEKKDDDLLDAGRYLAVGFSRKENAIPKEILVDRKIEALGPGWENSNLSLLRRFHEARIQSDEPKAFTLPRVAGPARRRMYAN